MTRKDYERAAVLIQSAHEIAQDETEKACARALVHAFVLFFQDDNPRFDEARFRRACAHGANVRART
jgi:hypothetical protein